MTKNDSKWPQIKKLQIFSTKETKMNDSKWSQNLPQREQKMNDSKCFPLSHCCDFSASNQFILLRGHLSLRHFYHKTLRLLLLLLLLLLLDQSNRCVCRFVPQQSNRNRNIIEGKNRFPRFSFSKHLIHSDFLWSWSFRKKRLTTRQRILLKRGCHERRKCFEHLM